MITSTEEEKAGAIICDLFLAPLEFERIVDLKDVEVDQKVHGCSQSEGTDVFNCTSSYKPNQPNSEKYQEWVCLG